jgi:hypothetical protein
MSKLNRPTYRKLTPVKRRTSKAGTASALKAKNRVDQELKRKEKQKQEEK